MVLLLGDGVNRTNLIKICGNQRIEDAVAAAALGANLLGFIFAPSRRQVAVETVRAASDAARRAAPARRHPHGWRLRGRHD